MGEFYSQETINGIVSSFQWWELYVTSKFSFPPFCMHKACYFPQGYCCKSSRELFFYVKIFQMFRLLREILCNNYFGRKPCFLSYTWCYVLHLLVNSLGCLLFTQKNWLVNNVVNVKFTWNNSYLFHFNVVNGRVKSRMEISTVMHLFHFHDLFLEDRIKGVPRQNDLN